jgi:hypothetical protein
MTPADFRRTALSLEGAEEGSHMGAVDFRVGGRIFATLAHVKQGYGNLMLTPEIQAQFVAEAPEVFLPVAGGWGLNGATHIRLAKANKDLLAGALRAAWQVRFDKNSETRRKPGSRRPKRALLVFLAVALSFATRPAGACQCVSVDNGGCQPPRGDVIFLGTVISKDTTPIAPVPTPGAAGNLGDRSTRRAIGAPRLPTPIVRVTISVSESFRGGPGTTVVLQTDTSDCAYPFEVGREYLVFANLFQGSLQVNRCTATRPAKMSVTTIEQLRAQRDGTALPDLFGFVGTHPADLSESGWEQAQPVPGVAVTARSARGEYSTRTVEDGSYAFRGLPAGRYDVSVQAPPGRTFLSGPVAHMGTNAGLGATCPANFELFYDGRISGTITRSDGQPVSGWVFAWYEGPEKWNVGPAGGPIENGFFEILRLAPGQYRLVYRPATGSTLYYPGTASPGQATLIEVGEGAHIEGLQFRVF